MIALGKEIYLGRVIVKLHNVQTPWVRLCGHSGGRGKKTPFSPWNS